MIVKYFDLKKNLKKEINFYLLYGLNTGLIEETIDNTFKSNFSKNIFYYEETEVLSNVNKFKEEIYNKSFFENDKLIIINRASDKILKLVEEIIDEKTSDIKIIIKSGILEKRSKIRTFFEKNKSTIVVPFYEDNYQSLMMIAQNFFKAKAIKISHQNINYVIERSKGSRIFLKNELKKIESFSIKKKTIGLDEILKLTNLAENYNISDLADQCLAKNKKKNITYT